MTKEPKRVLHMISIYVPAKAQQERPIERLKGIPGTHTIIPQEAARNKVYVPRIHGKGVGTRRSLAYYVAELLNNH